MRQVICAGIHLKLRPWQTRSGIKKSLTISLNYTSHSLTSGFISFMQMELYEIPSVFMDTKESLQRLKMRDKTRGCRADGRQIRQLWRRGEKCESLQANDLYAIIRRSRWRGSRVRLCNAVCLEKASIHCQKSRFTIRLLTESSRAPAALNKVCACVCVWSGGGLVPVYKLRLNCQRTKAVASANSWMNRFFALQPLKQSRCDWTTCQTLLRVYHGTFQGQSLWWIEP